MESFSRQIKANCCPSLTSSFLLAYEMRLLTCEAYGTVAALTKTLRVGKERFCNTCNFMLSLVPMPSCCDLSYSRLKLVEVHPFLQSSNLCKSWDLDWTVDWT